MTTSRFVMIISLIALILAAFVPAVSALEVIYDEPITEYITTSKTGVQTYSGGNPSTSVRPGNLLGFHDITKAQNLRYLVIEVSGEQGHWQSSGWQNPPLMESGTHNFTYYQNGRDRRGVVEVERKTNSFGEVTSTIFTVYFPEWDIGDSIGTVHYSLPFCFSYGIWQTNYATIVSETNTFISSGKADTQYLTPSVQPIKITEVTGLDWKHYLKVTEHLGTYYIIVDGFIDGQHFTSEVVLKKGAEIHSQYENPGERLEFSVPKSEINILEIISPSGTRYVYPLFGDIPGDLLRTGSVTMTDLNGNKITGFEVTAVNEFTGESYTVSTETDTAVITLPMDRTTRMPDPETGEYEDVPVGYYRFFGYKPGYQMYVETGIQVAVMPLKYRPYQFCDILVTTGSPGSGTLRTGTVSMIDHNGTTISGFEVKAVNAYTGEVYTATTDTDTAVITLPMDRTTTMPNPETGEYEETPVGYYRFFAYKPGYKMLNEDGIQIAVLPLKYRSYHFGDIIVTSEDGYLTGKHQFQLRSRADNSILQTGTISAQSATTGEWYNATVVNGIATLILPYDTSIPTSQYAGNYYVYGSSLGYLDSEFPAQVTVTPDEQSRIHTIYLTPIGGIPEPGNVTLRIQVISESGQGIPNANIFIAGVEGAGWDFWETYTTSSTGYLDVSVPANTTYDISVSAPGYSASSQRIEVTTEDPPLLTFMLYLSGWVTPEPTTQPTTQPTGWPPTQPTPTSGIPGDDGSEGFLSEAVRGISKAFGVGFATGKTIFGMLLALAIGFATAKQLRGGAAEFGLGLLGGTMLGVLIGLLPVWTVVVLLLIVGMYIGYRYVGGSNNG